ncbi:helix-turn-helix domain-containing protein [Frondihabitans australicus]|uniref:Helix-turn-helix protein n=1 Tax=Frondihabitans australicus TaxID=386892 RepID=A0A495IBC9_9MICO|nr:helix-turn-helix transcriptional regulator [Frondihabitans australicus]RKR73304.1 helix-turn-helix protein [Frondihabitans australicus]
MDDSGNPLGAFLRARRGLVEPSDHGIRDGGRRRVPGLRREELAFLAGVSAPYYARLEQGRDRSPSPGVLDAIAAVLGLDAEAVTHLHRLAAPAKAVRVDAAAIRRDGRSPVEASARPRSTRTAAVSPLVRRMIDDLHGHAALVVGRYRDVLAANEVATALNPAFSAGRNLVRDTFLDPAARSLYTDWRAVAVGAVAGLRASAGQRPDDPALQELVGELSVHSQDFRTFWARHDVHAKTRGSKRFQHPAVGGLDLDYQTFDVNGADGQVLHVFSAEPGTSSADGLALLALTTVRHAG